MKPEMHQSVVEIGTGVCRNIKKHAPKSATSAARLSTLARDNGLRLAAGGTHPFADWGKQEIYPDERYHTIVEDMKMVARANLIFGLHVHIGVEDRETAIQFMNGARYFLPHILALSTNSPFWLGMDTGLKSYRCKVFDKFPRTNIPDIYQAGRSSRTYVNLLIRTNCIDNAKKIWWDIRPHPHFPTLEFRICDMPMRLDETIAIAALCQAIDRQALQAARQNQSFRHLPPRAHHGEQVARRALWHRRQADRFRQAEGSAGARSDRRILEFVERCGGGTGQPAGDRLHRTAFWKRAPAPTASCASSMRPTI